MGTAVRNEAAAIIDTAKSYSKSRLMKSPLLTEKGTFGNLGMYISGIPVGLLVDAKGAKPGTLIGCVLLGVGYFGLYRGENSILPNQTDDPAYAGGMGSFALPWFCLLSFMTGLGGAAAFAGAIKTCKTPIASRDR